jgi:hypothetical protein
MKVEMLEDPITPAQQHHWIQYVTFKKHTTLVFVRWYWLQLTKYFLGRARIRKHEPICGIKRRIDVDEVIETKLSSDQMKFVTFYGASCQLDVNTSNMVRLYVNMKHSNMVSPKDDHRGLKKWTSMERFVWCFYIARKISKMASLFR